MTATKKKPKPKDFTKKPVWNCNLAKIRAARKESLQTIADKIGISKIGYLQIERGGDPMYSTAVRIRAALGVAFEEIWPSKKKV